MASFMIFVDLFTMPLGNIAESLGFMQRTAAASNRVFDFLEEEELPDESHIKKHINLSLFLPLRFVLCGYNARNNFHLPLFLI